MGSGARRGEGVEGAGATADRGAKRGIEASGRRRPRAVAVRWRRRLSRRPCAVAARWRCRLSRRPRAHPCDSLFASRPVSSVPTLLAARVPPSLPPVPSLSPDLLSTPIPLARASPSAPSRSPSPRTLVRFASRRILHAPKAPRLRPFGFIATLHPSRPSFAKRPVARVVFPHAPFALAIPHPPRSHPRHPSPPLAALARTLAAPRSHRPQDRLSLPVPPHRWYSPCSTASFFSPSAHLVPQVRLLRPRARPRLVPPRAGRMCAPFPSPLTPSARASPRVLPPLLRTRFAPCAPPPILPTLRPSPPIHNPLRRAQQNPRLAPTLPFVLCPPFPLSPFPTRGRLALRVVPSPPRSPPFPFSSPPTRPFPCLPSPRPRPRLRVHVCVCVSVPPSVRCGCRPAAAFVLSARFFFPTVCFSLARGPGRRTRSHSPLSTSTRARARASRLPVLRPTLRPEEPGGGKGRTSAAALQAPSRDPPWTLCASSAAPCIEWPLQPTRKNATRGGQTEGPCGEKGWGGREGVLGAGGQMGRGGVGGGSGACGEERRGRGVGGEERRGREVG